MVRKSLAIKSEKGNTWTVHLVSNDRISVLCVKTNNELSGYIYPGGRANQYVVVEYIPVRFLFKKTEG